MAIKKKKEKGYDAPAVVNRENPRQRPQSERGLNAPSGNIPASTPGRSQKQTYSIGGKEMSREEYVQGKRRAEVEVATGRPFGETPEERQQAEITKTAQRSIDIGKEKERLTTPTPTVEPTQVETLNASLENGTLLKPVDKTIEYETIIQTDETGFQREIQMPIGTSAKIAEGMARREGRVPFTELPTYQQFLAGSIVTGVSSVGIAKGGKFFNSATKELSKFMKTSLGKYVGQVALYGGIMTWLASDNLIGTMSIYGRDLADDVQWGRISSEEALRKFDDGMGFVEKGRNFIKTATILFPILWPFRKIILASADAASLSLEENRNRILKG